MKVVSEKINSPFTIIIFVRRWMFVMEVNPSKALRLQ